MCTRDADPATYTLYGFHPLREALRHRPHEVQEVLVAGRRRGARRRDIEAACRRHQIPCRTVPEAELRRLAGAAHNGFVARLTSSAARLTPSAARLTPSPARPFGGDPKLVVLVEDVQDPRNLGALLRVCEGAGVSRVLIRDRGSAPITGAVMKTAAGATEWLGIERIVNSAQALERLKGDGFWVYGSDPGGEPPWQAELTGPVVFCFGGEQRGLRPRTRKHCDRLLGLPMRGRVGSLNLATAAAALLYEAVRQRLLDGGVTDVR